MLAMPWKILKKTVSGYVEDDALACGAAISYYAIFSVAPVLIVVISIAGLIFGEAAARGVVAGELQGMIGHDGAAAIQTMIAAAAHRRSGLAGTMLGLGTLLLTATAVLSQMQSGLNRIWKVKAPRSTFFRVLRTRIVSLCLVVCLGVLMLASLVISAAVSAFGHLLKNVLPDMGIILHGADIIVSFALVTVMFGAIYKVLPDASNSWKDVGVGAVGTAILFTVGKTLIGLYIGHSRIASSSDAIGALMIILLWVYYSAQIFLLGAEFACAWGLRHVSPATEKT